MALLEFIYLSDEVHGTFGVYIPDLKMHFQIYGHIFLKFMDLNDTNYKLINLKYTFKVRGSK
jgi:hypothetical protein